MQQILARREVTFTTQHFTTQAGSCRNRHCHSSRVLSVFSGYKAEIVLLQKQDLTTKNVQSETLGLELWSECDCWL